MGNKRKHSLLEAEESQPVSAKIARIENRPRVLNDVENAPADVSIVDGDDEYVVWLVAKPADLSMDELFKIPFPRKPNCTSVIVETSEVDSSTGESHHIESQFTKTQSRMLRVEVKSQLQSTKQLKRLKPQEKIRGVARISRCTQINSDYAVPEADEFI